MKTLKIKMSLFGAVALLAAGCSSMGGSQPGTSGKDIASSGPSILNARALPSTVELDGQLQPKQTAQIFADVKDFQSAVTDVKAEFLHVPIEVPMKNVGGTTWRADLTPKQIQMLAVSGKTISYDANIVARDADGKVSLTQNPVTVSIKAPDLAQATDNSKPAG
jgi:hypothetical protein